MKKNFLNKTYIHVLLIGILGFLIYSNTFNAQFAFDDDGYIVQNQAIKNFSYFLEPSKVLALDNIIPNFRYAFVTRIAGYFTFALNYHIHGLDVTGYHVFNLVVHIINGVLVYFLIRLLFITPFFLDLKSKYKSDNTLSHNLFALFSSLIFISHPVQTQAVTYITQRFSSLAALFFLLSLFTYVKSRLSSTSPLRYGFYGLALISAIIAMLIKEISFTLPIIIMLFEVLFFTMENRKRVLLLFPFALTMLIIPATLLITSGSFAISGIGQAMETLASSPVVSRWNYLLTQFTVIVTYIKLFLLPINQNLDYDYPVYHSFSDPPVFLSFIFLLFLFALAIYFLNLSKSAREEERHNLRLTGFGILWFFITLSVESSIIPIYDVIFEHRLYLPSVGFIMAIMGVISMMVHSVKKVRSVNVIISAIILVVIVLGSATYSRNIIWQHNIGLWEDVIKKSPFKARPYYNLGVAYAAEGRKQDAFGVYQKAIQLNPYYDKAHNNLGEAYAEQGRIEDAIKEFLTATSISPNYVKSHYNLGVAYNSQGRTEDAIREYLTAIKLKPDNFKAHNNLANIYSKLGRTEDAVKELLTAILIDPDQDQVHYNLGILLMQSGRFEEADIEFQTAITLNPNNVAARKALESIKPMRK
jgi:Flp pilus assembly protein TadD